MDDYQDIMDQLKTIDVKDYTSIINFCKQQEIDVDIEMNTADNILRKIPLNSYKQDISNLKRAATACLANPAFTITQIDLGNVIKLFLKGLEFTIKFIAILEEDGGSEEDLEERMAVAMSKIREQIQ